MSDFSDYFSGSDFIAGWTAGIVGILVGHPLDTIKVREQVSGRSITHVCKDIILKHGPLGFFKGIWLPLLAAGAANSLLFGVYGNVLRILVGHKSTTQSHGSFSEIYIAGAAGGFAQSFVAAPVELVKIRSQVHPPQYAHEVNDVKNPYCTQFKCIIHRLKTQGLRPALYGLEITALRDVPSCGIYICAYEYFLYYGLEGGKKPSNTQQILAGGSAGVLANVFLNPVDVIKTRLQADDPRNPMYTGIIDCVQKSIRNDGMGLFLHGLKTIILRAFPVNVATFFVYEHLIEYLQ